MTRHPTAAPPPPTRIILTENNAVNRPEAPRRVLHTHLFTLRLWRESLGDGRFEWRGRVQHVLGGERHSFREWSSLVLYLERRLQELDAREEAE